MDKELWKSVTLSKKIPCPFCFIGLLKTLPNSFKSYKTKESLANEIEYRGQYPWTDFYFAGILQCNSCNEIITTCGRWTEDRQGIDIEENPETGELKLTEPDKYFHPIYFYPNLKMFKIPDDTPIKVKECINKSFALYWSDVSAAISKVRIAIEYLLDHESITRIKVVITGKRGKKPHRRTMRLSLEQRINKFKKKNNELAELLLGVKELGNRASHSIEIENTDLLLKTYETLEFILINLYNKPKKIVTNDIHTM